MALYEVRRETEVDWHERHGHSPSRVAELYRRECRHMGLLVFPGMQIFVRARRSDKAMRRYMVSDKPTDPLIQVPEGMPAYTALKEAYEEGGGIRITHPQKQASHARGLLAVYAKVMHDIVFLMFRRGPRRKRSKK